MKKLIINASLTFEGCTSIEVKKMNGDKSIVCDLIQEETVTTEILGDTTFDIHREVDFIFPEGKYPCELSEEDLEVLIPIVNNEDSI